MTFGGGFDSRAEGNGLDLSLPRPELSLCILQDLACLGSVVISVTLVTGNDGSVVEEVQQTTRMASQNDLFLGTFDDGSSMQIEGLLEFGSRLSSAIQLPFPLSCKSQ